jgi:hypothetical protein
MDQQSKTTSSRISSSYPLIAKVAKMNNQGVALLESGDFNNAIKTFSCALKACKVVACGKKRDETDTQSLDEHMTLSNSTLSSEDIVMITNNDAARGALDDDDDDDCQVIYRQAIVVPEPRNSNVTGDHTILTATMMATVIIFNDAITHHLWALETMVHQGDKNKREALKKTLYSRAAKLYELGLTLAQEAEMCSPSSLFVLANLNNMALVYKAMNANAVANQCLEKLLATLIFAIDCGDRVKFDGFFANASCLILSAAPAAAA